MVKYKNQMWKLGAGRKDSECCLCESVIKAGDSVYIPNNAEVARGGERLCETCGSGFVATTHDSLDGVMYVPCVSGGRSWGKAPPRD